jgi:hypothetical protein
MVQCDNCNRPSAIGGVLIAVDKYLENEGTIPLQCLNFIIDLYILMNRILSIASALVLSLGLLFSVSAALSLSFAQQNQTSNMTSMQQQQQQQQPGQQQQQQQNQTTGIGTAGDIENLTAGNIPVLGNATDTKSQNDTSLIGGLQKEQTTTDINMTTNQTGGGGMTNGTANQTGALGGADEQQGNQTEKSPVEQIGEAISGMFGGGNQSN